VSDGQKDEPFVEIWGSREKVVNQLYCIKAQSAHVSIVFVQSDSFFSLLVIRAAAAPFGHTFF